MPRNGTVRCAIYTRKSSQEGLDQEFNSLQAQREACEAFINSQRHEGWVGGRAVYDDVGSPARRSIGRRCSSCSTISPRDGSTPGRLQDRPADPLAHRFCQDRRSWMPGERPLFR